MGETKLSFEMYFQLEIALGLRMVACIYFFQLYTLSRADSCISCACYLLLCEFIYHVHLEGFVGFCFAMFCILFLVLGLFCFALLSSNASGSYSLSAPSSMGSLSSEGRDFMESSLLGLSALRSLTLH